MNTIKKALMLSVMAGFIASCDDNDNKSSDNGGDNAKNGIITSLSDPDYSATGLKGIIGADIELPAGEYVLTGGLVVRSPYTLKLNPGTTIKAATGGTDVYVIVEQGGK